MDKADWIIVLAIAGAIGLTGFCFGYITASYVIPEQLGVDTR